MRELHQRMDTSAQIFEKWATEKSLEIDGFTIADAATFYSQIYERRFRNHPDEGYAYLEELMAGKDPSPGYSILAKAMENTRHRLVVTTNFDNLVADALSVYTDAFPFVVGHEALTGFVRAAMRRPLVCKIHRDLLLGPKSDPRSLKRLHETWAGALRALFAHYTPVFIGYGGNDDSLMDLLESLDQGDIKGQLIWCYYEKSTPSRRIVELVAHHKGALVPVPDFDLLMILLGSALGIEPLDSVIEERAKKRAENYRERVLSLDTSGHPEVTAALSSTLERAGGWWAWDARAQREVEPGKREALYRQGLHKFPKSAELHSRFAQFLMVALGKATDAEAVWRKALEINPDDAAIYLGIAYIQLRFLRNPSSSEVYFQKALELAPEEPHVLIAYAELLGEYLGRVEEAAALFLKAITLYGNNPAGYIGYAGFMVLVRKNIDAGELHFKEAVDLAPGSPAALGALALFYAEFRGDFERSDALFNRAIGLAPKNQGLAANYAESLVVQKRFHDAKIVILRALDNGAMNFGAILVLNFLAAIVERSEGRDDSRFLGKVKAMLSEGVMRSGWRTEFLEAALPGILGREEVGVYFALLDMFRTGSMGGLGLSARWGSL
ncbi:SIR2 family protein [Corallococcus sp. AS-1-12]|uniref:SIR2 family protein n=1 Tax=Corallococcus sp. AS-1-12 TaxID=2874598 RepID=UPI001CBDF029|nr:SIR2 family protein [Corallococcus sp. AS-1-12]MBZ4333647.1 hypothetical protein [Corallococcus sp. AS-1-12]